MSPPGTQKRKNIGQKVQDFHAECDQVSEAECIVSTLEDEKIPTCPTLNTPRKFNPISRNTKTEGVTIPTLSDHYDLGSPKKSRDIRIKTAKKKKKLVRPQNAVNTLKHSPRNNDE